MPIENKAFAASSSWSSFFQHNIHIYTVLSNCILRCSFFHIYIFIGRSTPEYIKCV
jgi:hypothetical protein